MLQIGEFSECARHSSDIEVFIGVREKDKADMVIWNSVSAR